MSNPTQTNSSSTRPGVGTRIKGVFETAHGIADNVRGRILGAIDDFTHTGSSESRSHYASLADRGRMETERGMARIYGYPDPNAGNVSHNEPVRMPQPNTGGVHTTGTGPGSGYMRTGENDYNYHGREGGMDGGVRREAGGYGTDNGYGQPGVQNLERQQPTIDGSTEKGPDPRGRGDLSPNRGPQNVGSEVGRSPSQVNPAEDEARFSS